MITKTKSIEEIKKLKNTKKYLSVVISRHDLLKKQIEDVGQNTIVQFTENLNESQIKELSKILEKDDKIVAVLPPQLLELLLNTSNAPIYQFKMEHIYRDRIPKEKAEENLEEKMKELNFDENYMNILNYIDYNNPEYKNASIIKYSGLEQLYPSIKIPINELEKIYRNLKNGDVENGIKMLEKFL